MAPKNRIPGCKRRISRPWSRFWTRRRGRFPRSAPEAIVVADYSASEGHRFDPADEAGGCEASCFRLSPPRFKARRRGGKLNQRFEAGIAARLAKSPVKMAIPLAKMVVVREAS
jgi:hypothetical protein